MDDKRAACIAIASLGIGDGGLPGDLAAARVERVQSRIGGGDDHMVLVNTQTARRAVRAHRVRTDAVFPNQIAGTAVESLHRVAGVGEVDDPVVNDRSGLIRSTVIHGPRPFQTQTLYVAARNLGQWTIAPRLVVTPYHQPVAGIGM